jgi:hypothetical protein
MKCPRCNRWLGGDRDVIDCEDCDLCRLSDEVGVMTDRVRAERNRTMIRNGIAAAIVGMAAAIVWWLR